MQTPYSVLKTKVRQQSPKEDSSSFKIAAYPCRRFSFQSDKYHSMGSKEVTRKRMRQSMEEKEIIARVGAGVENIGEETEANAPVSEQMELDISHILEKIDSFTQLVSELLESGKSLLKDLSNEFEERMILIHKEQMEKWQEEIKDLRSLDASNEEINALLHNARLLLQNVRNDPP